MSSGNNSSEKSVNKKKRKVSASSESKKRKRKSTKKTNKKRKTKSDDDLTTETITTNTTTTTSTNITTTTSTAVTSISTTTSTTDVTSDLTECSQPKTEKKKGKGKKMCIFYASKIPNSEGKLNWYEFVNRKNDLDELQTIVKGSIELAPYKHDYKGRKLSVYVNEEGLLRSDLGVNDLAGGALYNLGLYSQELLCSYMGNVVVLGPNDRGLTEKDVSNIEAAIKNYRDEVNHVDEDSDDEYQDDGDEDEEDDEDEDDREMNSNDM
jgi:hypothetical protein